MKTVVYAICKNERLTARRWYESMSEADEVIILDTGSTDGTADLLRELGAKVTVKAITPFRFDVARNKALELVPPDADILVSTDLDEVFKQGWRAALEKSWRKGVTRAKCRYTQSFAPDGSEWSVFYVDKIHAPNAYRWVYPVHETLQLKVGFSEEVAVAEGVHLLHYRDGLKSRRSYLPLLELSVKENPNNARNTHYLGREYMYRGMWQKAIETLKRHIAMPDYWADERCASMRYIARCHINLKEHAEAEKWLLRAVAEAPYLREPFMDLADLYYLECDWTGVIYAAERALKITERSLSFINEMPAWSERPYDLLTVAYYNNGEYNKSLKAAEMSAHPSDKRMIDYIKTHVKKPP